jgi:hypothetical protein
MRSENRSQLTSSRRSRSSGAPPLSLIVAETYLPGVAKTKSAMKATLMKKVASTRLTVMKNGV